MDVVADIVGLILIGMALVLGIRGMLSFRGIAHDYPTKNLPFKEQQRLLKLARSGRVIEREDAAKVRGVARGQKVLLDRMDEHPPLSLLGLPLLAVGFTLVFFVGEHARPVSQLVRVPILLLGFGVVGVGTSLFFRWMRNRLLQTAEVNGWDLEEES